GLAQGSAMINDIIFILGGKLDDGMVSGTCRHSRVLLEYFPDSFERAQQGIRYRIGDRVVRPGPTTFAPHKIVLGVAYKHERAFDVFFGSDFLERRSITKSLNSAKVVLKRNNITMSPATVDEIIFAVPVLERELINRLSAVVETVDERFAKIILVRSLG